ncbi:MAG: hypothetical protein M0P66_16250, partial [Salinivirgaceae bacterium]|nr:hypothetical protein [Salinivirgaceae bacterium]
KSGQLIDGFDLLVDVFPIDNDMILVTNNVTHFERISNIKIEKLDFSALGTTSYHKTPFRIPHSRAYKFLKLTSRFSRN